jgi:hypothetical protein
MDPIQQPKPLIRTTKPWQAVGIYCSLVFSLITSLRWGCIYVLSGIKKTLSSLHVEISDPSIQKSLAKNQNEKDPWWFTFPYLLRLGL